ncbi:MAG: agl cluster protein AglQ [Cyanobacteria bacterium P01_A01_bin.137]
MNLYDILIQSATAALSLQDSEQGFMPPGHNGAYHDPETPVRNTAHWLITFLKAYEISGKQQFLDGAKAAINYLCSPVIRPMGATFWHRKNPRKDFCNGLMGQAWTIEALTVAAEKLEMPELLTIAEQVFLLHPIDQVSGGWQRVGVDGSYLAVDYTFNHQLWFAASGGLLARASQSKEVDQQVQQFLDSLPSLFEVYSSGLIRHMMPFKLFSIEKQAQVLRKQFRQLKKPQVFLKEKEYLRKKEVGYHGFNMYAFALLNQAYPEHAFWKSTKFLSTLKFIRSNDYTQEIQTSKYGFPYNPPGFEIPFTLKTFHPGSNSQAEQSRWISQQLNASYNFETDLMNKNTDDLMTHAARIYEATRLDNLPLDATILQKELA